MPELMERGPPSHGRTGGAGVRIAAEDALADLLVEVPPYSSIDVAPQHWL